VVLKYINYNTHWDYNSRN